jgi:RND superfamily putative drug exporter
VGESISASAGTVILALLTLLFASFGIYHDLGVPLAIGIAVMLVAGVTLLPALLSILGRAVFWPANIVPGEANESWWGKVAQRVIARPAHTLAVGVIAFGALAFGSLLYSPAGFGGATAAPNGSDAAAGNAALMKYFPQSSSNPTNLILRLAAPAWQDPGAVVRAEKELQATGLFNALPGPLDPAGTPIPPAAYARLHAALGDPALLPALPSPGSPGAKVPTLTYDLYRATARFVSPDGHTIQFEAGLTAGDAASTPALNAVPSIRKALTAVQQSIGATASGVAGEAPALYDVSSISDSDLIHIVPIAIIAIGLLLALVLRSLVAPLYLIASVMLSYLAALGLASIIFIKLAASGGLTFLLPFLMFIFLLALGEDYNILVMTRIREEAHQRRLRDAVVTAVGASGPTITSAGLVLAGTFLVLAVTAGGEPGGSQIRDIGIGLALGILMDTFLVRSLLVPSTVSLLGRWNWWPGKLAEMDVSGPAASGEGDLGETTPGGRSEVAPAPE